MKRPIARPTQPTVSSPEPAARVPRAFTPDRADAPDAVVAYIDPEPAPETLPLPPARRPNWLGRVAVATGGLLLSLALGLWAERLISELFAANPWLGGAGLAIAVTFGGAVLALATREMLALRRLRVLDRLRRRAEVVLDTNHRDGGRQVLTDLLTIYHARPDLARAQTELATNAADLFDGAELIRLAERRLMAPIDARARTLTAASARRVALVTAVSPRALVDVAFVAYESFRLAGAIARLYGARPGLFGSLRLIGAVLSHLAVTGGLALTDGVVEQLVGQGLAARISSRLGEGLVNGLMTVRVGIAAMRVVRPLPFATQRQPMVKDFIPELANVTAGKAKPG